MAHLKGLKSLGELSPSGTKATDAGIADLAHVPTFPELKHLINGLKQLSVWNTKITEEGLDRLYEGLPGCRIDTQPP
jgi:hypothetical protein